MRAREDCCLCSQIAGHSSNDLIAHMLGTGQYVRRVPIEDARFAVVPSLGPLVDGHVILCPRRHYRSLALLPSALDPDFAAAKAVATSALGRAYGKPVHYFEHGSARDGGRVLCTVAHAHLHLVPADLKLWPLNGDPSVVWRPIDRRMEDLRREAGAAEYLYYESPDGEAAVATSECGEFQSQYMRKLFAEALGRPTAWNWRSNPDPHRADATFRLLRMTSSAA